MRNFFDDDLQQKIKTILLPYFLHNYKKVLVSRKYTEIDSKDQIAYLPLESLSDLLTQNLIATKITTKQKIIINVRLEIEL